MLKYLKLENVGPAAKMELDLAHRLNIITGDNGLGKSFLLDVAWFVNTGSWPRDVNSGLTSGYKALPRDRSAKAIIELDAGWLVNSNSSAQRHQYEFERFSQSWSRIETMFSTPKILTIYALADGAVAIFDHARSGSPRTEVVDAGRSNDSHIPAFVFTQQEIMDGAFIKQKEKRDIYLSNGLIMDWAGWQKENGETFRILKKVLAALSPDQAHPIEPGELTRISIDDARDMPTILMSYGDREAEQVPVVHASSAMRRIVSIAYMLVWMWEEHKRVAHLIGHRLADELLILLDEVECHLHPSWQRKIVPALLEAVGELSKDLNVQLIATTHSPLVMASLEPHFDAEKDAWFDLDLVRDNGSKPEVVLTKRTFRKYGDAGAWLHSRAFDLTSTRSLEGEALIREAEKLMGQADPSVDEVRAVHQSLVDSLDQMDEFWDDWRLCWRKKGVLG